MFDNNISWPNAFATAVSVVALATALVCVFCVFYERNFPWFRD